MNSHTKKSINLSNILKIMMHQVGSFLMKIQNLSQPIKILIFYILVIFKFRNMLNLKKITKL